MARLVAVIGTISMTIYVLHTMAGAGTRILLIKAGVADGWATHLALGVLAGVMLPAFAHQLMLRFQLLSPMGLGKQGRRYVQAHNPIS